MRAPVRKTRSLVVAGIALLACSPAGAAAAPVVDQSFTTPGHASTAIGECCDFVAQTFTAGRDGLLAGVNIDTYDATPTETDAALRVSIRSTENGLPSETVLASTVLPSTFAPLSQLITFPQSVQIRSGVLYAIVVNLENPFPTARGAWDGGTLNPYPRGDTCAQFKPGISGGEWFCYTDLFDSHFRTYVTPLPTSQDQCRNGGWRNYPGFTNQGDCVSFVATGGRNPLGKP
jgi:hypothetical protein